MRRRSWAHVRVRCAGSPCHAQGSRLATMAARRRCSRASGCPQKQLRRRILSSTTSSCLASMARACQTKWRRKVSLRTRSVMRARSCTSRVILTRFVAWRPRPTSTSILLRVRACRSGTRRRVLAMPVGGARLLHGILRSRARQGQRGQPSEQRRATRHHLRRRDRIFSAGAALRERAAPRRCHFEIHAREALRS